MIALTERPHPFRTSRRRQPGFPPLRVALVLAAAVLPAAPPAVAQTTLNLQSGDAVQVGGGGTSGTYHGQPVSTNTTSYSSSANSSGGFPYDPASNAVSVNGSSAFTLLTGGGLVATGMGGAGLYDYGGTATISGGTISSSQGTGLNADLQVTSGRRSSLSVTGGTISGQLGVYVGTGCVATIGGGTISGTNGIGLNVYNGEATVSGGAISGSGYGLYQSGTSTVTVTGGSISSPTGTGLYAANASTVTISGGAVGGGFFAVSALDTTVVTISGGGVTGTLDAEYGGTIDVTGGAISGSGPLGGLYTRNNGVIDLFGTFNGYHTGDRITSGSGTITGTLLNGQAFSSSYFIDTGNVGGTIEFNVAPAPTPEPAPSAALGLGALGVAGLALRARALRRTTR